MTAYGTCWHCGRPTGCDPGYETDTPICPGTYRKGIGKWECYNCDWQPETARKKAQPGPRMPNETRQEWRKRMRGK